ncbi:subtilisin-like protein [Anaeromyces robustus]|uniref:Subtilisin-like protein n=1 Tax=Anaeromyces robustus TaxID=1754192 RepID=A0A1Y1X360_9FUNG|nr:subtilisin-like protein [Anaeromyces robustus]|eukprot:ORX80249.1 subtilisin-like protein [Anaeromyces robustus]
MNSSHLILIIITFNIFVNILAENAYYVISIKRNENDKNFDDESKAIQTKIIELVNDRMNDIYEIIEDNMDTYHSENGEMNEILKEISLNSLKKRQFDKPIKYNFINKNRPNLNIDTHNNINKRSVNSTNSNLVDSNLSKYYPSNTELYDFNYYYPESAGQGIDLFFIDDGIDMSFNEDYDTYKGKPYERIITCDTIIYDGISHPTKDKEKNEYCIIIDGGKDAISHGVSVASVAAGTLYGVAKKANIHMIATSLNHFDILEALDYIKMNGTPYKCIINLSRGGWNYFRENIQNKITELSETGFIIFASSGNTNENCCIQKGNLIKSFSYYDNVIVVGVTENTYQRNIKDTYNFSFYSNFGNCVDIHAPGEAFIPSKENVYNININGNSVEIAAGSSVATPIVVGVAATIMSEHPEIKFTYELMLKTLIDFSLKDILKNLRSYDTPNRFVNNGKRLVFSPSNYYNGCGKDSPIKTCSNKNCCSKYGTCIDPSDDIYDLCYIGRGCQSEYGECHETQATSFITEPILTINTENYHHSLKTVPNIITKSHSSRKTKSIKIIPSSSQTYSSSSSIISTTKTIPTTAITTTTTTITTIITEKPILKTTTTSVSSTNTITIPTVTSTITKKSTSITSTISTLTTMTTTSISMSTSTATSISSTFDWDCKQQMSNACYQELDHCWKKSWYENQFKECIAINEICSKIWNS